MKKTRLAAAVLAAISLLAACGSSDDADGGVASLGSTTTAAGATDQPTESSMDPQEAMLAYTQCMRDEGIDMPDPEFGDNGMVTMGAGSPDDGPMSDVEQDEMDAASEACAQEGGPIMAGAAPAGEEG